MSGVRDLAGASPATLTGDGTNAGSAHSSSLTDAPWASAFAKSKGFNSEAYFANSKQMQSKEMAISKATYAEILKGERPAYDEAVARLEKGDRQRAFPRNKPALLAKHLTLKPKNGKERRVSAKLAKQLKDECCEDRVFLDYVGGVSRPTEDVVMDHRPTAPATTIAAEVQPAKLHPTDIIVDRVQRVIAEAAEIGDSALMKIVGKILHQALVDADTAIFDFKCHEALGDFLPASPPSKA